MTFHLSEDLERSILAEDQSGHFASVDEAMTEAALLLLRREPGGLAVANPTPSEAEFKQQLLNLMTSLPIPPDPATRRTFRPVTLEVEPLSETIIREGH